MTVAGSDQWPVSDPADTAINIAAWPDEVEVTHPGCCQGFHPYGMADAWEAAAVATRRAITLLRDENTGSDILSLIQSRAYFDRAWPGITFHRPELIPCNSASVVVRRTLAEALSEF